MTPSTRSGPLGRSKNSFIRRTRSVPEHSRQWRRYAGNPPAPTRQPCCGACARSRTDLGSCPSRVAACRRPALEVRHKALRNHLRDWAGRGIAALRREQELREKLGMMLRISRRLTFIPGFGAALTRYGSRDTTDPPSKTLRRRSTPKRRTRSGGAMSARQICSSRRSASTPRPPGHRLAADEADGTDTYKSVQRGTGHWQKASMPGFATRSTMKTPRTSTSRPAWSTRPR